MNGMARLAVYVERPATDHTDETHWILSSVHQAPCAGRCPSLAEYAASPSNLMSNVPIVPQVYTTSVKAFKLMPSFAMSSLIRNRNGISTSVP